MRVSSLLVMPARRAGHRAGYPGQQLELAIAGQFRAQRAADGLQSRGQVLQAAAAAPGCRRTWHAVVGDPQADDLLVRRGPGRAISLYGAVPGRAMPEHVRHRLAQDRGEHGVDMLVERPAVDVDPDAD